MEVLSSQVEGVTLQQLDCVRGLEADTLFFCSCELKESNDLWRKEMQPDENL